MNDEELRTSPVSGVVPLDERAIRRLLELAGRRPRVPEDDLEAIKKAARVEWRGSYGGRRPAIAPQRWALLAAAATLLAVGLAWWVRSPGPSPVTAPASVATVELVSGPAELVGTDGERRRLSAGQALPGGAELETGVGGGSGPGRVALLLAGGRSLRIDAGTLVRLASSSSVQLRRGAVYVDSLVPSGGAGGVVVRTPSGLLREVGTQFEVRVDGGEEGCRLRVREGEVTLERAGESFLAGAGEQLVVHPDGTVARGSVAVYGPHWDWVQQAAPILAIEGETLGTFLDWVARETGWRIELADDAIEALRDTTVLHGSVEHLTPADAPAVVLPGCGLTHRLVDGTLIIGAAP